MSIKKPYYRNVRQFINGDYSPSLYVLDPQYAKQPEQYIRAFMLLQKDLKNLFDYIDTSDDNLNCFSHRTHELLLRTCVEVEANCKAILLANGFVKKDKQRNTTDKKGKPLKMNMGDYNKLEITHKLSSYKIKIPHWRGENSIRIPFKNWSTPTKQNPDWYEAYHETKHNRLEGFEKANFGNLLDAFCGLLAILSTQFYTEDFSTGSRSLGLSGHGLNDGMEPAIGDYFRIKFPDWPENERYSFTYQEWKKMSDEGTPFQTIDYTTIS